MKNLLQLLVLSISDMLWMSIQVFKELTHTSINVKIVITSIFTMMEIGIEMLIGIIAIIWMDILEILLMIMERLMFVLRMEIVSVLLLLEMFLL